LGADETDITYRQIVNDLYKTTLGMRLNENGKQMSGFLNPQGWGRKGNKKKKQNPGFFLLAHIKSLLDTNFASWVVLFLKLLKRHPLISVDGVVDPFFVCLAPGTKYSKNSL
jgi:hypothetical protein